MTTRKAFEAWADSVTPAGSPKPIKDNEIAWYAWQAGFAAGESKGRRDVEELAKRAIVLRDAIRKGETTC
jgi:hypothetical protein